MKTTDDDGVRRITFDRPDVLNAFTTEVARDLAAAIEEVDPESHDAVVLTGEGRAFSAGGDVQSMAEREEPPREAFDRVDETFCRLARAALGSEVPIVARVNGDAVGAGLAVVALADFAYAVESARFSCAFVRVGLIPDTGATFTLPDLVGLRAAKRLALTAEFVPAAEAAGMGLVNEAVADETALDAAVDDLLDTLRQRPTVTLGLTKRAMHGNLGRDWRDALDHENHFQTQAYATAEHEEGVAAFVEDREPEYPS